VVSAQGQTVIAEVDSAHFMIGDQLKYRLKIKDAANVENPYADFSKLGERAYKTRRFLSYADYRRYYIRLGFFSLFLI